MAGLDGSLENTKKGKILDEVYTTLPKMRNMIIKHHNMASMLIVQALQRDHAVPTKLPTLTKAAQINYQSKA